MSQSSMPDIKLAPTGDTVVTQADLDVIADAEAKAQLEADLKVQSDFQQILDLNKPEIRTTDPRIVSIGNMLQRIEEPLLPNGAPALDEEPEWQRQLPWFLFSLIVSVFIIPIFFKRGKK